MLTKSNRNSATGPDGVSFGVLSKLDSCNHILSTLYSKVLAMGNAPPSWGEFTVNPIHKKGDPIALSTLPQWKKLSWTPSTRS